MSSKKIFAKIKTKATNFFQLLAATCQIHPPKMPSQMLVPCYKRESIIRTNAEKGAALLIRDLENYIDEYMRQLNEESSHRKLQHDPAQQIYNLINETEHFKKNKLICGSITKNLIRTNPRAPKFYLTQENHEKYNPSRQIISSVDCHTCSISRYVEYHLQPIAKQVPLYVNGSKNFVFTKMKDLKRAFQP